MIFQIDKQTLKELEIFPENGKKSSIFEYFNSTKTTGGKARLFEMMQNPYCDFAEIDTRIQRIKYLHSLSSKLELDPRQFDSIERYLTNRRIPLKDNFIDAAVDSISYKLKTDADYYTISEGIFSLLLLLNSLRTYINTLAVSEDSNPLGRELEIILDFLHQRVVKNALINPPCNSGDIKAIDINKLDDFFRVNKKKELGDVLTIIYELDALQSIVSSMKEHNLVLPELRTEEGIVFEVSNCYHPFLESPIKNDFSFEKDLNLCFITGPNMSGKSTFLKTTGILVFLSHLGFPVPAANLNISVFNGLSTSINPSESLELGLSHFYSEVRRVKEIATQIESHQKMFLILDELFRGTNVKDAQDATYLVVKLLAKIKSSRFVISSHILEVCEMLAKSVNIDFRCFSAEFENDQFLFNFKLNNGITKERTGMYIVKKENIEGILERIIEKQKID